MMQKKKEAETEPGKVLVGHVLSKRSGKNGKSKLRSGLIFIQQLKPDLNLDSTSFPLRLFNT